MNPNEENNVVDALQQGAAEAAANVETKAAEVVASAKEG